MPANFRTASLDAYWRIRYGDEVVSCRTNGLGFVKTVQQRIKQQFSSGGSFRGYDGVSLTANSIQIDGKWGPNTNRGIWVIARDRGAPADMLAAIQRESTEGTGHSLGVMAMTAGIWLVHFDPIGSAGDPVSTSNIGLAEGDVYPQWNIAAPGPEAPIVCVVVPPATATTTPPMPADATPVPPSPPPTFVPTTTPPIEVVGYGTDQTRLLRGEARPGGGLSGAMIGWGILGVAALGLAGVWALGDNVKRGSGSRRRRR